jgi:Gluconate 2-dehydrogenase subunit 3
VSDRYPGYNVLNKRDSPSWNDQTRAVLDRRLAIDPDQHRFFNDAEWATVRAVCDRIIPQPSGREPVPLAVMVDEKLHGDARDGYRDARLPPMGEAWRRGLAALNAEARSYQGCPFHELPFPAQDAVLTNVQAGHAHHAAWGDMPPALFFAKRVLHDVVSAYYAHPTAWNEIGFGGPASPRGYVRLNFDRRDPWEASEARPGREETARKENARVG